MSATGLTDEQTSALAGQLAAVRDRLHTPADVGRAIVDFVLTEAASRGSLSADGNQIEVPLTATLTMPEMGPVGATDESSTGHTELCISAFGHHIICLEATMTSTHTP